MPDIGPSLIAGVDAPAQRTFYQIAEAAETLAMSFTGGWTNLRVAAPNVCVLEIRRATSTELGSGGQIGLED